jgi:membrane-bound inhibitor of C-type lysozyme
MNLHRARVAVAALSVVMLAGCGGISLWPFGDGESTELSRKPANATEYLCDGGKRFYVRTLDAGAVWLIAPDREIRLEKLAGAEGASYGVGRVVLELSAQSAMLTDPPAQFAGCKRADARP